MAEPTPVPVPKRRPGRPPVKKVVVPVVCRNILKEPDDPMNRLEMTSDVPVIFKEMFTCFKSIGAIEIHIKCTPINMIFFAFDHVRSLRIMFKVNGSRINSYYCESTFMLFLSLNSSIEAFNAIGACYNNISFIQRSDSTDSLTMILRNFKNKNERSYKFKLSQFVETPDLYDSEHLSSKEVLDAYPICFTLDPKVCKKTITDLVHKGNNIRLIKQRGGALHFESQIESLITVDAFMGDEEIKLRDNTSKDEEIFMVEIESKNLKTIHNAFLSESDLITIYASSSSDMVFTTRMEGDVQESVSMATLLKIKNSSI